MIAAAVAAGLIAASLPPLAQTTAGQTTQPVAPGKT